MAESLHGSPETIITLLISDTQYTVVLVLKKKVKEKNVKKEINKVSCPGRTMARGYSVILLPLPSPDVSPHSTGLWTIEHGFLLIPNL